MNGNLNLGAGYFFRGLSMLGQPGLRLFVIIPLLLNIVIFSALTMLSLDLIDGWVNAIIDWLPDWQILDWLRWILWPLMLALLLVIFVYSFSIVANLIASPFNGLLAEKVEARLQGKPSNDDSNLWQALRDAPRAIRKELSKIGYYLPRAIGLGLLSLPLMFLFPPAVTAIWFIFGAWMMSLQYIDFPMDNHQHNLRTVRLAASSEQMTSFGFGAITLLGTMIPLANLIVMPAAVCGATIYWVERLQQKSLVQQ